MEYSLQIDAGSARPKYQQIADALLRGIEERLIGIDAQLPSINEISARYHVSRDTVERAYKILKRDGIILSVQGRGYFARERAHEASNRVLVLFNKLSDHKRQIFEGLTEAMGESAVLELQVYHEDFGQFEQLLERHRHRTGSFVIIANFLGAKQQRAGELIRRHLAGRRVAVVSSEVDGLGPGISSVTQDYRADIMQGLQEVLPQLRNFDRLVLLFDPDSAARGIIVGFQEFALAHGIESEVITTDQAPEILEPGTVYVCVADRHLVQIVKRCRSQSLALGREIGLIAYNDSELKEVLAQGITVITTDHHYMGQRAGELLLSGKTVRERVPFRLIRRETL